MDTTPAPGKTFVAPGVLITVAKLAALSVPGVIRMSPIAGGVNRLFRRGWAEGVRLETEGETVSADLFIVVAQGGNVQDIAREVQREVARAIREMIGLEVGRLDVHLEDIEVTDPKGATAGR
ncbi:MAG: Asp23/Gls24 family envelope stress response protein [Anaerolineales bacterium]|jgi:uncharacterized alkaline shock family protein YloU